MIRRTLNAVVYSIYYIVCMGSILYMISVYDERFMNLSYMITDTKDAVLNSVHHMFMDNHTKMNNIVASLLFIGAQKETKLCHRKCWKCRRQLELSVYEE